MVVVKMTETYDLSTQVGKMGIIGVHTPTAGMLARIWGNAIKASRYVRLVGCDVTIACASALPADPLQIGTEAGKIAPSDMFNPILYTACSNEGFDRIVNRIYKNDDLISGGSVNKEDWDATGANSKIYYALLAEERFKKAMPQAGLRMAGLVPLVHEVLTSYGNGYTANADYSAGQATDTNFVKIPDGEGKPITGASTLFRGKSHAMPSFPSQIVYNTGSGTTAGVVSNTTVPKTYVACLVLPPMTLTAMYFRMKVTWYVELTGIKSDLEVAPLTNYDNVGANTYYQATNASKMESNAEMLDTVGTDIEPVMTSTR